MPTVVFGVRVPEEVAQQLETVARAEAYRDRNPVVNDAIARFLCEKSLNTKNPAA